MQNIFSFRSFEISEDILRKKKLFIGLDSFSNQKSNIFGSIFDNTSLCIDYPAESCKFKVILFGSMLPNLKGH